MKDPRTKAVVTGNNRSHFTLPLVQKGTRLCTALHELISITYGTGTFGDRAVCEAGSCDPGSAGSEGEGFQLGLPRGPSGREQIQLAPRFYLVCRDINGTEHNPPLLFTTWRQAKAVCFRQGEPGDAVFVGLPTKTEVEIAVRAAELRLPAALGQQ
eukprot:s82_g6.t1